MPPAAVQFVSRPYVGSGRLSDLVRQRGRDQAEAELRAGENQAQLWGNLASIISGTVNNIVQQRQQEPIRRQEAEMRDISIQNARADQDAQQQMSRQDTAFMGLLEMYPEGLLPPREVISIYGPQRGSQVLHGLAAIQEIGQKQIVDARDTAGRLAMGIKALSPQLQARFWPGVRQAAIEGGLGDAESIPEQATPEYLDAVISWASGKAPAQAEGFTLNPGQRRFGPSGQQIAAVDAPPEPVKPVELNEGAILVDPATGREIAKGPPKREPRPPAEPAEPLIAITGPDGKPVYVRRSEAVGQSPAAGTEKASSGQQKRVLNFFNRARQADVDLEGMEEQIQGMSLPEQAWMASMPNFVQTETGQQYTQAQRAFTEARLRKDSGAAIPEQEFANDRKTYFAQPGDSKATLDQKRRARAAVLSSLAFESGQALSEFVGDADEAKRIVDGYKARAAKTGGAAPAEGTYGTVNGKKAVWKTVDGKAGWYAR